MPFDLEKFIEDNAFDAFDIKTEAGEIYESKCVGSAILESALRQALSGMQVIDTATHVAVPKYPCKHCNGEGSIKYWAEPDQPLQEALCGYCQGLGCHASKRPKRC